MRRILSLLVFLALITCLSACGGSTDANVTSNANGDTGTTTGESDRANNSNMAPRGGPGTEPAN
jgi:hypothetical protein